MVTFIGFCIAAFIGCIVGYRIRGNELREIAKQKKPRPPQVKTTGGEPYCEHDWTAWGLWGWYEERRYCKKCSAMQTREATSGVDECPV